MELDGVYPKFPDKVPHNYNPISSYLRDFPINENYEQFKIVDTKKEIQLENSNTKIIFDEVLGKIIFIS